jgi:hypothetical protein
MGNATEMEWFEEIGLSPDEEDQYRQQQRATANDGGVQFHQQVQQQEQEMAETNKPTREEIIDQMRDTLANHTMAVVYARADQSTNPDMLNSFRTLFESMTALTAEALGMGDDEFGAFLDTVPAAVEQNQASFREFASKFHASGAGFHSGRA